ncbi:MAG: dockerin type I repeat-containing protein [Phycisphaerales bacterium]|nr:MAG: dockerin type I repeat-containing protein [Phycisphaerales bacterium]
MMGIVITAAVVSAMAACGRAADGASAYSIYEIQYTTDPGGSSPLEGQIVDCLGGIVTHKFGGFRPKLTLQDPNAPEGWGAIQVKDWLGGVLYDDAAVGDWVTISNALVEEFRGNTILQCMAEFEPTLTVVSRGHTVPQPLEVALSEIAAPLPDPLGDWYVSDHSAEKYEHMWLKITNVEVTDMDLGKAADNYVVVDRSDPNAACWLTDYMNQDTEETYHPHVTVGQTVCRIQGILEQYTNTGSGWDYYQLVTTQVGDFLVTQPADLNGDCDVDFTDFRSLAANWLARGCLEQPERCAGADLNEDGAVDADDLTEISLYWLGREPHTAMDQDEE